MYQASKKFGDAIAGSNRKFNTRLLENEKVLVESVKNFTITSGAEEITIGSAVASYVQATIENKGIALSGKEVSLEIGVEVDGEMEYIPMGLYTIQNPKIESNKVTFTAYDRLASRCNGAYYSKLSYPTDAVDILAEISTMTSVAIDTSTVQRGIQINQRAIIEEGDYNEETDESEVITTYVNPFDGYTYKETIGFIAGLFGKFAICGRTGMIEFRWYQGIDYEIPSNIFYNDLQETEESFSIKRLTCDNSDQTLSSGSGATGISMQNPVMTQSILDGVYNTVQGLIFTPAALRFIGDTRLDIGDIITAVKNDGMKFTIPIISLITSYDGGLMQTIASYGNTAEEDDSDTKGPITEMAERVEYELAFVKKLMVDNLIATNATIKNLSGDILKFKTGEFETLKTDVANFKQTFTDDLQASNAKINTLESDHATFKEATATNLNATNARIANIEADYLKATDAKLTYATITNLNTTNAEITKLKTKNAEIDKLVATKATITDLNAAVGRVGLLESSYANLNTLVNGNLTSDNIQNLTLTSKNTTIENGMIKNAMIENLSFDKITGMDINTTNLTVHSSDGKSKWSDNTIQISDANRVRVQIGKDASNDYSMSVWDKNGNLIWDALGATEKTIQRKIIRDGIVADDANISGSKLDINSVIKEVNGSTTKLKSSTIVMNDKNQTLEVVFNEMETTVADNLSSAKLYADGKLSDAQKYALEQANSALSSAKSYADSAVDNIEVGGRNLLTGVSSYTKDTPFEKTDSRADGWVVYQNIITSIELEAGKKYVLQAKTDGNWTANHDTNGQDPSKKLVTLWLCSDTTNDFFDMRQGYVIFTPAVTAKYKLRVNQYSNGTDAYTIHLWDIKLEKGSKATDWTPAPEDTQSRIDNITEITTSHTTSISTMQGQISSLISEDTTIKGSYDALLSRYNATVATVDSMKTTIGEHTTILNNQNDSIAAVTTKANTIESNLAGTTQTVSEVKSNLAGTQERVTKVETSLSGLTTRVSSTETNLANLEIGGRNLVLRSKDFTSGDDYWYINGNYRKSIDDDGFTVVSISRSGAGLEWNRIIPHAFIPVEEMHRGIIVSFDFMCDKVSELDRGCICALQTYNSGGGRIGWHESQDILSGTQCKLSAPLSDGKWIRVQVPFSEGDLKKTYGSSDAVAYTSVSLQLVSNGSIHFKKVKIEYGNKATDYTEAPEDVDQKITAAETIASQTADKFNWLVKSGTNSTDFELTDRTATLVASAINMNGLVTFSGLNTDLQNTINNKTNVSYLKFSSGGNKQGFFKIATLQVKQNYANQNIIFGVNHREHGYTECRIKFSNAGNTDPGMGSFKQTGTPTRAWRIIKTATSTWDLYLAKTDSWDSGSVIKFDNPYGDRVLVTWSGASADLPDGAIIAEQMITDQTTIDGGIITTGYLSADRIAAGSITADKIDVNSIFAKDITATGTITGVNLIGATGTFSGQITATEGTIGRYDITETYLKTGSGSTCSGIGSDDCAFWAGGTNSKDSNFIVSYDGSVFANNLMCNDRNSNDALAIINGTLYIQSDNNSSFLSSTGFEFKWGGDCRILSMGDGVKCYHTMYATDFVADGWIYNASGGHYTWKDRTDAYISCGSYNNTNNIYYYAGYHAFYVNGDSGSGMMYIETSGVSSRKGFRNSSDERIKKDFRHFDNDFIKSYMQLEPIKYRFKDDTDISYHIGFKAQNVNSVLNDYGKSHNEQFGICATHHINSEYAEKTYGEKNMTEVYTLAYDELIGANTFMIQKTRKDLMHQAGRIDMQEAIINDLQTRLLQVEKTIKQSTQALV
nr:tail fiber domain-containing protein [uncultured Anaerostipes sp.]